MTEYERAVVRINTTPGLEQYRDILLYDWPESEHWDWVASASVEDIIQWADDIRAAEAEAELAAQYRADQL